MREILFCISHFKRLYNQFFEPYADKYHLSQLEIDILLFLQNNPEYNTARDIVTMRGFAKSNVSKAVDSLRRKGYLTIKIDPDNRKLQRLIASPTSHVVTDELAECQERCFSTIMKGFSEEDCQGIREQLRRIDRNILAALTPASEEKK